MYLYVLINIRVHDMRRVNYNCGCYDSGIYKIVCTESNKIYIGSAYRLGVRYSQHKTKLAKNEHPNPHLQSAYSKYGIDSFYFEVLELCNTDIIIEREQYYIDSCNAANRLYGYNIRIAADSCLGIKRSEEHNKKMGAIIKRLYAEGKMPDNPNFRKSTWRSVDEYFNGVKTNTYESAVTASKVHNICYKSINNNCRGITKGMRVLPGYTFKYTDGGVAKTPKKK